MVRINKIYTKTGDDGQTHLVGGKRVSKDSLRVEAYGTLDELMTFVGASRFKADSKGFNKMEGQLRLVLNELFDVGALLATPKESAAKTKLQIRPDQISRLEIWIDEIVEELPELKSFTLPGDTDLNSELHKARAKCRTCERRATALSQSEEVDKNILIYLNRLSDFLYALTREASKLENAEETLWNPGASTPESS